jgi:hypothetical protein
MTKLCSICKTEKPIDEFYEQRKRNGHMNYCKVCSRAKAKKWTIRNAAHIRVQKREYKARRRSHYTDLQRNYIARLKADGKYPDFLARKREWYRRRRQYLPCPSTLSRAHRREAEGYVTPRRINKLNKVIAKVIPAVHFTAEKLPDKQNE